MLNRVVPMLKKIVSLIRDSIESPNNWHNIEETDVLLVCHDHDRGYTYKGKAYAPLLDSLGDILEKQGLKITSVAVKGSRLHGYKAYRHPYNLNRLTLSTMVAFLTYSFSNNKYGEIFDRVVCQNFVVSNHKKMWLDLLNRCKCKIIIGIQPYSTMCEAAREIGIEVYDLQHGLPSKFYIWYDSHDTEFKGLQSLPTGFICWDANSAKMFSNDLRQTSIKVYAFGHPWFMRFIEKKEDDKLVQDALSQAEIFSSDKPCVLVSLQWGMKEYAPSASSNHVMPDVLVETVLETINLYNWMIRLHPVQLRGKEYKFVTNFLEKTFGNYSNSVEWQKSTDYPLPLILTKVVANLTYSSSTTIEASWMGVPTGLLCQEIKDSDYFSQEQSKGIAEVLPLNLHDILFWLKAKVNSQLESPRMQWGSDFKKFFVDIATTCRHDSESI